MPPRRKSQRISLSCTDCARRKLRCSKTIPCSSCSDRGKAATCQREVVEVVKKSIPQNTSHTVAEEPQIASPVCGQGHLGREDPIQSAAVVNMPTTETVVALEFLTHGRRNILDLYLSPSDQSPQGASSSSIPQNDYIDGVGRFQGGVAGPAWDLVVSSEEARQLIEYHHSMLAWMHNTVDMPDFKAEFELNLKASPEGTWAALYYALLSVSPFIYNHACRRLIQQRQTVDILPHGQHRDAQAGNRNDGFVSNQILFSYGSRATNASPNQPKQHRLRFYSTRVLNVFSTPTSWPGRLSLPSKPSVS